MLGRGRWLSLLLLIKTLTRLSCLFSSCGYCYSTRIHSYVQILLEGRKETKRGGQEYTSMTHEIKYEVVNYLSQVVWKQTKKKRVVDSAGLSV